MKVSCPRNVGAAIRAALSQFKSNGRSGSKKVIVLFVDGPPIDGIRGYSAKGLEEARSAAQEANKAGVPIYTIALAQITGSTYYLDMIAGWKKRDISGINKGNQKFLSYFYNDTDSGQYGGISAIAGNGGRSMIVNDSKDLSKAFATVARQLVSLVQK